MDENMTIDTHSGNAIRKTDNGPKEGDLPAVAGRKPGMPLELGPDGLPIGWEAPDGDR